MDEPSHQTPRAYVGLGSNLGDRAGFLLLGLRGILHAGLSIARLSSVYETAPVDVTDQPPFLNMVAELTGVLPAPEQLLARLLRVEYALGRRRDAERPRGPRTLDLDLLLYGDVRHQTDFLTLPHPRLHLRRFALTPLVELAPDIEHPALGKTFSGLLAELSDPETSVRLWQPRDKE
ncbi:MAG TPA: 2-amino-4-hydroxy-6-hydroxymethyldihydropteridine diphosphokinase [Pyrinomonadaceae bacterium]|nr:2-amino-4-hydroxy-6-hydroxymethyldihydropteridine diphosphokinase [Pyrinomonadaceae bacterium]